MILSAQGKQPESSAGSSRGSTSGGRLGAGSSPAWAFWCCALSLCVLALGACHDGATCADPASCPPDGGSSCPAGTHDCQGGCVDDTRVDACGAACVVCTAPVHAVPRCLDGGCEAVCENGYADCNGDLSMPDGDGCETDLSQPSSCGACGLTCPAAASLCSFSGAESVAAMCVSSCAGTQTQCGQSCVELSSNLDHCGACSTVCDRSHASAASCDGTACAFTCAVGYGDCDKLGANSNGCETQINGADVMNCGGCGVACTTAPAHATPVCGTGVCDFTCDGGYMRVGAGCVRACMGASLTNTPFAGGTGSMADPYVICTAAQLDQVRNVPYGTGYFKLLRDLDLGGVALAPIGDAAHGMRFEGTFDGGGFSIANWTYSAPAADSIGFFAFPHTATLRNLSLVNVNVTGNDYVGGLFGQGIAYVSGCSVSGAVHGNNHVGGLAGTGRGSITGSSAGATVQGNAFLGGLVGDLESLATAFDSFATGSVTGTGNDVGGLVGYLYGGQGRLYSLLGAHATGTVSGVNRVGGLVGSTGGLSAIGASYATGSVTGTGSVGGLVGDNYVTLSNNSSSGAVTGISSVGGLVGLDHGLIAHCVATGLVTGTSSTGGLVGSASGGALTIAVRSFWDTSTSGQATSALGTGKTTAELMNAGTFAGWESYTTWALGAGYPSLRSSPVACVTGAAGFAGGAGSLADPYRISQPAQLYNVGCNLGASFQLTADLDFTGQAMVPQIGDYARFVSFTGRLDGAGKKISNWVQYGGGAGLFGYVSSAARIENLVLENVEVGGSSYVGGLVAFGSGQINKVRVSGLVRGLTGVGGLIGYHQTPGAISRSGSSAAVIAGQAPGNSYAGGFAGTNEGSITDCYASGSVTALSSGAGGFVSGSNGPITNAYAVGAVNQGAGFAPVGMGLITHCYWDTAATGQAASALGAGLSTAAMQTEAGFVGWDFASVWQLVAGQYPTLR